MSWFRLRLTFKLQLLAPHATAASRLNDACRRIGDNSRFLMHDSYGELHLPAREHRLWSPHLFFDIAPLDEEQKSRLLHPTRPIRTTSRSLDTGLDHLPRRRLHRILWLGRRLVPIPSQRTDVGTLGQRWFIADHRRSQHHRSSWSTS